jgi:hypothetical protein
MALTDSVPAPDSRALAVCLLVTLMRRDPAPPSTAEPVLRPPPAILILSDPAPPSTTEPYAVAVPPVAVARSDPAPPSTTELGVISTGAVGGRPDEPGMFPGSYKLLMQESSDGIF